MQDQHSATELYLYPQGLLHSQSGMMTMELPALSTQIGGRAWAVSFHTQVCVYNLAISETVSDRVPVSLHSLSGRGSSKK